jgi:YfiR/HmsC-like
VALIRDILLQVAVWLAAGGATAVPTTTLAQSSPDPEYQLKAVFLFNFAQFVEWPASAFPNSQTPLVIGILGEDPFGPYLDETVRGESVNDRPLVVRRYRSVEEITVCHILFISRREDRRIKGILDSLRGRSVLTVSDADRFATRGGMIRFVTDHKRIRFRINLEAARAASLTLSSKLLRPAEIVPAGKD